MNTRSEAVHYDVDTDGLCTLTMDLPGSSTNTLGAELTTALRDTIRRAAADTAVRGIVLTSGKPGFGAGADLKTMGAEPRTSANPAEVAKGSMSLSRDLRYLETCGKPVVAAINGTALGGAFEIALACHHRVLADTPTIRVGLPESQVGLLPGGGGTQRLPRLIGVAAALPLLLQGTALDPGRALELGIVDAVVAAESLVHQAKRWLLDNPDPVAPWDKPGFTVPGGTPADTAAVRQLFTVTNAMTRAGTYGNDPAPAAISAAVYEGLAVPFDTALLIEGRYFARLFTGPVSKARIRTFFLSKQSADKLAMRPRGIPVTEHRRIGVLGAGTMGAGLALAAARSGLQVVLIDTSRDNAERGRSYAESRLARDVAKGRRDAGDSARILARITATDSYDALADVSVAIEAVFESRSAKTNAIERADRVLPPNTVLATNTSQMPITGLAEASTRPEWFIGMHFFAPAERMPLVEIIRGEATADGTLAAALDLARALRKTPIVINDSPGFFTSRFIGSFMAESMRLIADGVNPVLVENAARMVGMPMGAMTLADTIGLDTGYHAARQQAEDFGGPVPDPGIAGILYSEHGRAGMKTGKGFYDYASDGTKTLWPGLRALLPASADQPDIDTITTRILYAQLAEGARSFAEGVLLGPADGDLGACLGVGFPAHLGGPFIAMDQIGIATVVATLNELAAAHGDAFAPPELLREMATSGATFYGPDAVPVPERPAGQPRTR